MARLVEALSHFFGQGDKLHRKVLFLFLTPIFLQIGLRGVLARLLNHRGHLEAHGNGAGGTLGVLLIERQHQAGLEKTVSPAQVGLEGWSQRIAMPLSLGHMFAVAPDPGVVGADDDAFEFLLLDGLLQNRMKQGAWLPGRAGEDLVVGRPIFLGIALKTDGAREGAPAHAAQNAEGQRDGPLQTAFLRENKSPAGRLFQ